MLRFYLILCFISFSACNVDSGESTTFEFELQDESSTTSDTTQGDTTQENTTTTETAVTTAIPQGTSVPTPPDLGLDF
jgi:hypothetical protein